MSAPVYTAFEHWPSCAQIIETEDRGTALVAAMKCPRPAFVVINRGAVAIYDNQNDEAAACYNPVQWSA